MRRPSRGQPDARRWSEFDAVRKIGLLLAGVEEGTAYGAPALKVGGKMFACIAIHRSAEPGSLAVRIDFAQRDEMIAAEPDVYYLTEHYVDYPVVLVRLARVHPDALRDLLHAGWRFMSTERKINPRGDRTLPRTRRRGTR